MNRLNAWQWLWIVSFVPWVVGNNFAFTYMDNDWMFGYWDMTLNRFLEVLFPAQSQGITSVPALLAIFVAYLVPYVVLYNVANVIRRIVLEITAGFKK